jgi:salicylate hydroxylase
MTGNRKRIVVAGAGIAGSLIVAGLADEPSLDVVCLERVAELDHSESGTGLNIGPNALKCLAAHLPESAARICAGSLDWRRWTVALTDGEMLMDVHLLHVADNAGIRIRWAELYTLLRAPIARHVLFNAHVCDATPSGDGVRVSFKTGMGNAEHLDAELLIAADGRYSIVRDRWFGEEQPTFLGVCLYRLLFPVGSDCPIDDYGQWFNGPNRLLAFRVPGDFVYCAGSFPIPAHGGIPEELKQPAALRRAYTPIQGELSREAGFLVEAIEGHADQIHWARLQEGSVRFAKAGEPVLLVGDAAHPMVPTLGQGATQAVEDACVVVDEIRAALRSGRALAEVPGRVEARRRERVRFVVDFSRDATDTMLEGADPRSGTLRKTERPFQEKLERLYRDVPMPAGR